MVVRSRVLAGWLHLGAPGDPRLFPAVSGWVLPHGVDTTLFNGAANLVPVFVGTNRDEGDEWMGAPSRSFARLMTARGAPTYMYIFSRVGDDSVNRQRGAYHSAEITFVFGRARPLQPSAGTTSYDGIATAHATRGAPTEAAVIVGFMLILAGFGFQVSAVPFHMWAPDAYEGAPQPLPASLSQPSQPWACAPLPPPFVLPLPPIAHELPSRSAAARGARHPRSPAPPTRRTGQAPRPANRRPVAAKGAVAAGRASASRPCSVL